VFFSHIKLTPASSHQPVNSIFLSQQTNTSHQPQHSKQSVSPWGGALPMPKRPVVPVPAETRALAGAPPPPHHPRPPARSAGRCRPAVSTRRRAPRRHLLAVAVACQHTGGERHCNGHWFVRVSHLQLPTRERGRRKAINPRYSSC
jgi:hypothetical protein